MKRSTCSAVARQRRGKSNIAARLCICLTVLLVLGAVSASAQSTAVPPTTTLQILGISPGTPAPSNPPTAPVGGIILYGSRISPITNQPVRHFWIGDTNFGLCRVDPDIDTAMAAIAAAPGAPSPFSVTITSCPFKLNGLSVTGGPMAFDPINNKLYLTDEQTNAEAILRLGYLPTGDNGEGALDFSSFFSMAGNITGSRFQGGTTGCPFPIDSTTTVGAGGVTANQLGRPNAAVLGPDGNLYVGFKKTGGILRINNPATADVTGFGTCDDFVQLVAATPARSKGNGMAFIGNDLWGSDTTGPFVIKNATTTCQALSQVPPQTPTCAGTRPTNAAFAALAPTQVYSDQTYPYLNGNNLYMGNATDDIWVGNIFTGGNAVVLRNPYEPAGAFVLNGNATINVNGVTADMTDPANVVMYSGDDPTGAALLGQGRWWFVNQNPPARHDKPSQVTVVRASAVNNTITVSWSPAQTGETVTSYTVHASTVPQGVVLADQTVLPALGGTFPPNFLVIPGLPNGTYAFRVIANNAQGNNGLNSTPSVPVTLPAIPVPLIPTNVVATAGDTVAFVNFAAPPNAAAYAITGYQITSIPAGGVSPVLAATATSGTVTGLTDGTSYTFTVHAINAGGISMESTPSNAVTPAIKPQVAIKLTGPIAETTVPVQATFTAALSNNTATDVTATTFNFVLSQATPDGASIVTALTGQGTCDAVVGNSVNCTIGTLAAGATVNVNIIVNIVANSVTGTATFNATDIALNPVTGTSTFNIATPTAPPQGGPGPTVAIPVTASSGKPQLNKLGTTTHTFTASNTTSTVVTGTTLTISEPATLTITSITPSAAPANLGVLTCQAPAPGVLNGIAVNNIVCTIPSFGGNLKGGTPLVAPQTISVVVGITAPGTAQSNSVSAVLSFNGVDGVSPVATFTQIIK